MDPAGPMLSGDDLAALTFSDKLSLSWALCRGYGLTVLGLLLTSGLALGFFLAVGFSQTGLTLATLMEIAGGAVPPDQIAGQLAGLLLLVVVAGLVMQFCLIGLNALVLRYIDNQLPVGAVTVFLSPWARVGPILLCLLPWLGLYFICQIVIGIFGAVPPLRFLVELALSIAYSLASNCATFYIADKILGRGEALPPREAVSRPLEIVRHNPRSWLGAFFFICALNIPLLVLAVIGVTRGLTGLALVGGIGMTAVSMFALFLFGVTYRQALAQYERAGLDSIF